MPFCASVEAGDLGERRVGTDPRRPHDQATAGVDGGAGDGASGLDLDRHRFARQQRGVDGRRSFLDDSVGGDLLAGPHDVRVEEADVEERQQRPTNEPWWTG